MQHPRGAAGTRGVVMHRERENGDKDKDNERNGDIASIVETRITVRDSTCQNTPVLALARLGLPIAP